MQVLFMKSPWFENPFPNILRIFRTCSLNDHFALVYQMRADLNDLPTEVISADGDVDCKCPFIHTHKNTKIVHASIFELIFRVSLDSYLNQSNWMRCLWMPIICPKPVNILYQVRVVTYLNNTKYYNQIIINENNYKNSWHKSGKQDIIKCE